MKKLKSRVHKVATIAALLIFAETVAGSLAASWADGCIEDVYCVTSTSDSGEGTLRYAIDQANLDTTTAVISFADQLFGDAVTRSGTVLTGSGAAPLETITITLQSTLEIRNGISIIGPTSINNEILVTIERGSEIPQDAPLLEINPDPFDTDYFSMDEASETVTIKNIHINSNADMSNPRGDGVAIQVNPTIVNSDTSSEVVTPDLVLINVVIENSISADFGGAINSFGHVVLESFTAINNYSDEDGGAISAASVSVSNSTFLENVTQGIGGAIFIRDNLRPSKIDTSTFRENRSNYKGGAIGCVVIADDADSCFLEVKNSAFTSNATSLVGGAIYSHGSLQVLDSKFSQNAANPQAEVIDEFIAGGAIAAEYVFIARSTFSHNSTHYGEGGAIYVPDLLDLDPVTFSLVLASDFKYNSSINGSGGAISGPSSFAFSTFRGNTADSNGDSFFLNISGDPSSIPFSLLGNVIMSAPESTNQLCDIEASSYLYNIASDISCISDLDPTPFLNGSQATSFAEASNLAKDFIPDFFWQDITSSLEAASEDHLNAAQNFARKYLRYDINGDPRPTTGNWSAGALQMAAISADAEVVIPPSARFERNIEAENLAKAKSEALRKAFLAKRAAFAKARAERRVRMDSVKLKIEAWRSKAKASAKNA